MAEYKQYAWQHITVRALGKNFVGIRGVKYKRTSDNELLHGRGRKAIAIQQGNESCEGEIVVLQSELEALIFSLGVISLTQVRFDLVVTYDDGEGTVVTDLIKSVQVSEYEKGMNQGDKFMEITIPFLALDIQENI